jgi:hypothetical protein
MPALSLCHIFVLVEPEAPQSSILETAGLRESYRRQHSGQGTANVCYCFDNAYLELLWVTNAEELNAPAIVRTRLAERARWRETGASPFGIGLRSALPDRPLPFPTWTFAPPYLPPGLTIPVSTASEDPRHPFVFGSPGSGRPDTWSDGRAGVRQSAARLAEIADLQLSATAGTADLEALAQAGLLSVTAPDRTHGMVLTFSRRDGGPSRRLSLPDFVWLD